MIFEEWKIPRQNNSGRQIWSQIRILHALKNITPNGLRYNELLEQINKSAEETKIPEMSSRTLSKNLELLQQEGSIVESEKARYITGRGFERLRCLDWTIGYGDMLKDPTTILIGQEPEEKGDAVESFTVLRRTERTSELSEEVEQQLANMTNEFLGKVKELAAKGQRGYEIKIQATITDKRRKPFSIYDYTDSST